MIKVQEQTSKVLQNLTLAACTTGLVADGLRDFELIRSLFTGNMISLSNPETPSAVNVQFMSKDQQPSPSLSNRADETVQSPGTFDGIDQISFGTAQIRNTAIGVSFALAALRLLSAGGSFVARKIKS